MEKPMSYKTEFPDFHPDNLPAIPSNWVDQSWHNDVCPSWSVGSFRVWVDFALPQDRDFEEIERFRVTDEEISEILFASDDWQSVLDFVEKNQ
jgi:hypothetical protein